MQRPRPQGDVWAPGVISRGRSFIDIRIANPFGLISRAETTTHGSCVPMVDAEVVVQVMRMSFRELGASLIWLLEAGLVIGNCAS